MQVQRVRANVRAVWQRVPAVGHGRAHHGRVEGAVAVRRELAPPLRGVGAPQLRDPRRRRHEEAHRGDQDAGVPLRVTTASALRILSAQSEQLCLGALYPSL